MGLFGPAENIDALAFANNGDLLISTYGAGSVDGNVSFSNGDLLRFAPTSTGPSTAGTWSILQNGTALGFNGLTNNLDALWAHPDGNRIGFSAEEDYSFGSLKAENEDLLLHFLNTGNNAALLNTSPMGLRPYNVDGMFLLPGDVVTGSNLPFRRPLRAPASYTVSLSGTGQEGLLDAIAVGSVVTSLEGGPADEELDVRWLERDAVQIASEEAPALASADLGPGHAQTPAAGGDALFSANRHKDEVDEAFEHLDRHDLLEEVHTPLAEQLAKALVG